MTRCEGERARRALAAGFALLSAASAAATAQAAGGGAAGGDPAAVVEHAVSEAELATVRMTSKAVERLGVQTAPVLRQTVPNTRIAGGVVEAPPGGVVQVVAPQQGTILVAGARLPVPGTRVRAGEPLLLLRALSAAETARAREILDVATARLSVAEAALAREPGDAARRAERDEARVSFEAARGRLRIMSGEGTASDAGGLAPLSIRSPVAAVVRRLDVTPGQSVPSGAPLLELVRTDEVWIRVPLYAGLIGSLRPGAPARIRTLGDAQAAGWSAEPVQGPPSADPLQETVDLYFRVSNAEGVFRPGERVVATLLLGEDAAELTVPDSALLYDVNGGTWVYERLAGNTFARRRVAVARVSGGLAVLSRGPAEGTPIVTHAAAEIFGSEFDSGK